MKPESTVIIVGAGIVGIATAYYLARTHGVTGITLVDPHPPMAFTSAQSGENYRNWWPHPAMVALTNHSIDLMEQIARDSANQINMTRRGYVLATRQSDIAPLIAQLHDGLQDDADRLLRYHDNARTPTYQSFDTADWTRAPDGVDILRNRDLIQTHFPTYDPAIQTIIHIRRGGDISGQQLGSYMLDYLREQGARLVVGTVRAVRATAGFEVEVEASDGTMTLTCDQFVNAAGPFAKDVAGMLDVDLPVQTVAQQKIAFEDRAGAIPRTMPFSIDLDPQMIDWAPDEAELLQQDPQHAWLAGQMPGAIHCRPDGGDHGRWVKLGWAYNTAPEHAGWIAPLDPNFPEIVLRGAARLNPALKCYYGKLPRALRHYGGWYTMTQENWPLIGPMGPEGSYMNCAFSGFGTMASCASGALCADWIADAPLPDYAQAFSRERYADSDFMNALNAANKGIL